MKKKTAALLTGFMIFASFCCSVNAADVDSKENSEKSNILIAYFSVPEDIDTDGIDANAGASIVVKDEDIKEKLENLVVKGQENIVIDENNINKGVEKSIKSKETKVVKKEKTEQPKKENKVETDENDKPTQDIVIESISIDNNGYKAGKVEKIK